MTRSFPCVMIGVFVVGALLVSSVAAADLDAASVIGSWAGRWETSSGGRGAVELTFTKVDGSNVLGTYRLESEGVRGQTPPFIGKDVTFSASLSNNTITLRQPPPPGTMTISGREMKGQIGTGVTFTARKVK